MKHLLTTVRTLCSLLALAAVCPGGAAVSFVGQARAAEPQKRQAPQRRRGRKTANPAPPALVKSSNGLRITVLSVEGAGESWADSTGATYAAGEGREIMLVHLRLQALPGVRGERKFEFQSPTLYMSDGTIADTNLSGFILYQYADAPLDKQMTIPFSVPEGAVPGALSVGDADFDLADLGEADAPEVPARADYLPESFRRQQEISELHRGIREQQKSFEEQRKSFEESSKRIARINQEMNETRKRYEQMAATRKLFEQRLKQDPGIFNRPLFALAVAGEMTIPAGKFSRGVNVEVGVLRQWGTDFVHNAAPYRPGTPNEVEYEIKVEGGGAYVLSVQLAAEEARPVDFVLNGETVYRGALGVTTGGWHQDGARWFDVGRLQLRPGVNSLVIRRADAFPHLFKLRLTPVKQ